MNMEKMGVTTLEVDIEKKEKENLELVRTRIESIVHSVDYVSLEDILEIILCKIDSEINIEYFVPLKSVYIQAEQPASLSPEEKIKKVAGKYIPRTKKEETGYIVLFANNLKYESNYNREKFVVVHTLIHEQVHALSDDAVRVKTAQGSKRILGFSERHKESEEDVAKSYVLINEGMTELIADIVTKRYFNRTGELSSSEVETFLKQGESVYGNGRKQIQGIVQLLQEKYEVSEEVIFNSLISFYFGPEEEYDSFPEWLEQHEPLTAEGLKRL